MYIIDKLIIILITMLLSLKELYIRYDFNLSSLDKYMT